ncbi:MAG: ANTAR domain-containing protein [Gemmatales bacterium]|nr:ANTAR domain-containing protein [Gemmatales bacterium]MDW8388402.1 ANTAR domain-containing protein [Gemmatales bacterium]
MRVWLIEDPDATSARASLQPIVESLIRDGKQLVLVGVSGWTSDLSDRLRAAEPEVVLYNGVCRTEPGDALPVLDTGLPLLVALTSAAMTTWAPLAEKYPLAFVSTSAGAEEVWSALLSLLYASQREGALRIQVTNLSQRLGDRIIIEKAKGVLMQTLGLSEEEAYMRMRVQSRRQRKKVREIAQSILDSRFIWEGEAGKSADSAVRPLKRPQRPAAPGEAKPIPPQTAEREGA